MSITDFCKDIPLVNIPPGIKKAVFLLECPEKYDSYVYRYTNADTGVVIYIGYHSGDLNYWGSPKKHKKEMDALIYNKDANLRFEIVGFGTKEEMIALEAELIAKERPIYNASAGSFRKNMDAPKVTKFLGRIKKGDFKTKEMTVEELEQLNRHQCRAEQYDIEHIKEIEERIKDGGVENCQIVVLEKERNSEDGSVEVIIDGNHTIQALSNLKMGAIKIKVNYIPYHIASSFSDVEIEAISHQLNPDEKVVKKKETSNEVASFIARTSVENNTPITLPHWKDFFANMNWSNAKISRTIDKAVKLQKEILKGQGHKVLMIYKGGQNEKILNQTVESHKNKNTYALALSTGRASIDNIASHVKNYCIEIDPNTGKKKIIKKHLFLVMHHPSTDHMDNWCKGSAKKDFLEKMDLCFGHSFTYELYEMPAYSQKDKKA